MKRILIISFSNLHQDARVYRQIECLSKKYEVFAIGFSDPCIERVSFAQCRPKKKTLIRKCLAGLRLLLGKYEGYYWNIDHVKQVFGLSGRERFDLVIANDIDALPVGIRVGGNKKVIFDAHEYSPLELEDDWKWNLFFRGFKTYLCRQYIPCVDGMFTVSNGIAEAYKKHFEREAVVIMNAPYFQKIEIRSPKSGGSIRLVHHGGATKSRKLEQMIRMLDYLDERFLLDLYLVPGDEGYLRRLSRVCAYDKRVRILSTIPMHALIERLSQYDVGVYLLPPSSFNNKYALPNKLFDFIQARLAIAIGPSPEMKRIVQEYGCGVVADEFTPEALAREISALTHEKIQMLKKNTDIAARSLCFEVFSEKLLSTVESVLG